MEDNIITNNGTSEIQILTGKIDTSDQIAEMKKHRLTDLPNIYEAEKSIDKNQHNICFRKDKEVKYTEENDKGEEIQKIRIEEVAKVSLALQNLIINRAVSFLFGNAVNYSATTQNESQATILTALNKILKHNKETSLNRRIARSIFAYKEAAEVWYTVNSDNTEYGFRTGKKLRCKIFTPKDSTLYPFYDNDGDLVAFSREYKVKDENGIEQTFFETYTAENKYLWKQDGTDYKLEPGFPQSNGIGKIPVIYGRQEKFETQDVDKLIDRLEVLLSHFADTNDYHAAPKIFVTGQINGWTTKGESGAVIEGEEGAQAQYLSWSNAPESVKLEIETLLRMIYTITQTPDIAFDSVKGLGSLSGVALKLLFMDAHLKVQDKREIFDEYLQRRVNVLKAYIGSLNPKVANEIDNLDVTPEITPYIINSDTEQVNMWQSANGGKPLISHKASVISAGLTSNPEDDFKQIEIEQATDNAITEIQQNLEL